MSNIILPSNELFVPGTVKPEEDYKEFERLGAKLGLPCTQVHVALESRDAAGNLIAEFSDRSRTFNRNFWNQLFRGFGCQNGNENTSQQYTKGLPLSSTTWGAGHLTTKNPAGTITNSNDIQVCPIPVCTCAVGTTNTGIVVGTGSAAEDFEGYALSAKVNHGTTAGTLSYQAQAVPTPTYNAGTKVWTAAHVRILNNNSGGTITVTETAMFAGNGQTTPNSFMIMRDLLGAAVSVLNAGQLTVTYTFTLTFPA